MTASNSPLLTVDRDSYVAGQAFADRVLSDPALSSAEAIILAANVQGAFACGFDERLGAAAVQALDRMRASGAPL